MNCPKCKSPGVLIERSSDSKTKTLKCGSCGLNETRDRQGRPLLTEVMPARGGLLVG